MSECVFIMKKGSTRPLNHTCSCSYCNASFACADPTASRCQDCRRCPDCGILTRSKTRYCIKHQGKHLTHKQSQQLKRLHKHICGNNNPSKRPEVRQKLSDTKKGDLNPARIYREQYAEHIRKYRPGKISKLEILVATALPHLITQYKIGKYTIDLANPENKIAIEVQGCWFHSCQMCFPDSPHHPTQLKCKNNDMQKKAFLLSCGWKLVELAEHDIRNKSPNEIVQLYEAIL